MRMVNNTPAKATPCTCSSCTGTPFDHVANIAFALRLEARANATTDPAARERMLENVELVYRLGEIVAEGERREAAERVVKMPTHGIVSA